MSMRAKVLELVDVMMRVPPILVIDEILKISMGLPMRLYTTINVANSSDTDIANDSSSSSSSSSSGSSTNSASGSGSGSSTIAPLEALLTDTANIINNTVNATGNILSDAIDHASKEAVANGVLSSTFGAMMDDLVQNNILSNVLSMTSVKFIVCLLVFLCATCTFMLWTRQLVMVYMFAISLGLTFLSYWSNLSALTLIVKNPAFREDIMMLNFKRQFESGGIAMALLSHIVAQWFMGILFAFIHLGPRYHYLQKCMPVIFVTPIVLGILPLPIRFVQYAPLATNLVPLLLTKITIIKSAMEAGKTIYNGYQYAMNFVSNFGLSALIENEWHRLNVPTVLRVFWTIRIAQGFVSILFGNETSLSLMAIVQKLLVDGCETLTAVLGMTSIISIVCHYIGQAFQWYLLTFDNDDEKSLGTVSAVLFYILALQTGLTSLSPDKRFVRLCRNLCLLMTALLHFLHNIVSPILMSLSAARNPSRKRHVRALSVCAFLVISPILLLIALWSRSSPSTWSLAVTAFSVEVIVKVLVSLATYTLFLLDARRATFWEKLDDYLYYVRAFGNSVEFCFGILLFFNGAWILVFESAQTTTGGAIRAIMMCIHAYFNIWCEARSGWTVFMKRRSAVHKISSLPEATSAQLRAVDDVCAICYQEMYSAKITRCHHFFHGVCLRKWLYVQDRCPLCHQIMMYTEKNGEHDGGNEETETANAVAIYPRDDNNETGEQNQSPDRPAAPAGRGLPSSAGNVLLLSPNVGAQD